jgi:hypothetical protein
MGEVGELRDGEVLGRGGVWACAVGLLCLIRRDFARLDGAASPVPKKPKGGCSR